MRSPVLQSGRALRTLPFATSLMAGLVAAFLPALVFADAAAAQPAAKRVPALLPDRTLTCDLGHASNVDTTVEQTDNDVVYDSRHSLTLHLPARPARSTPPPDAVDPPEPVTKGTGIVADPDGIASNVSGPIRRVIDLWPARVELTIPMAGIQSKLIVISDIDEVAGRARMFMTDAMDVATYDTKKIYAGNCLVMVRPAKRTKS